ncbi:1,2-phenylacetyl-CoA epoxidase subunit PaaD [Umezawaea sp. Da 62-37]|uniref:1,2-phenylacetyl-CoA epoxidase subunit PaaD n=1 Tax=Umezawaea sp. Da 62-37 TaxID=3075927 RepID=UPI0028F7443D|nr:1,2-phenylacetyl-CoA epoxidase subunit PaaD [Umezawaea sp. Da 62-37]WNV87807.1 1,2-phenylacetyl-CoA epoxidase subunit PaaD [Umezawaea sp. Da 62-37]
MSADTAAARAHAAAASVRDPEIRVLSLAELGILRAVEVDGDRVVVTITPTYLGCPAMDAIRGDVVDAVRAAGFATVEVVTSWSPPWTTDWLDDGAREKLRAAGIAPPARVAALPGRAVPLVLRPPAPRCPSCDAADTAEIGRFGSTACKALRRCTRCQETFDHFKEF